MTLDEAIVANVRYQAVKLRKGSTVLSPLLEAGTLAIVGGVFDRQSGTVRPVAL